MADRDFPAHGKSNNLPQIVDGVVAYARAWDGVLAEWGAGRLDVLVQPYHNHDAVVGTGQAKQLAKATRRDEAARADWNVERQEGE